MNNTQKARLLRKSQTDAENFLWSRLRNRRLGGYKFRRQVPVGPYVADFMCQSSYLIIEVDGGQHVENREYDQYRDDFLRANGYKVMRFWNNEVLNNLDGVLEAISLALSPHPNPLPTGEGKEIGERYLCSPSRRKRERNKRNARFAPSPCGRGRG